MTLKPVRTGSVGDAPPEHLSEPSQAFWRRVVAGWNLEDHHLQLLENLCRQWDVAQQARAIVEAEGVTVVDRFGQTREHPAVKVERDAMTLHRQLVRELDLDAAPAPSMPTKRGSRYR